MSTPVQNSTSPVNPTPNPEIKAAEQRVDQAGYARNQKEAIYKQAVKDHGADSAQAVTAKAELTQAQAEVEKQQGELRKLFKVSAAPRKPTPAPAPAAAPATSPPPASEIAKLFKKLEPIRSEMFMMEQSVQLFRSQDFEKALKHDSKFNERIEKIRKEIENGTIKVYIN